MIEMNINTLMARCLIPTSAKRWVYKMLEGDTYLISKFSHTTPKRKYYAQAAIQKEGDKYYLDSVWKFPKTYAVGSICSRVGFTIQSGTAKFDAAVTNEDIEMCLEVVRRISIHRKAMTADQVAVYVDEGFNPLYGHLWLDKDLVSKSIQFKGGDAGQPHKSRLSSDFIERVMINEEPQFEYFNSGLDVDSNGRGDAFYSVLKAATAIH